MPKRKSQLSRKICSLLADLEFRLCPLGLAFHNETGDCFFLEGSEPCGKNMIFVSDEDDPAYGVCVCKYGRKSDCIAKPVVYWNKTNTCYPLFEQVRFNPVLPLIIKLDRIKRINTNAVIEFFFPGTLQ